MATASGSGAAGIWQNFSDRLILDLAKGATCASQAFIAAAPAGLGGKFNSDNSALDALA
jgi:hypothetical protein